MCVCIYIYICICLLFVYIYIYIYIYIHILLGPTRLIRTDDHLKHPTSSSEISE